MTHASSLRKRNNVVLFIVTASVLIYGMLVAIQFFPNITQFPWLPTAFCLVAIALFYKQINEKITCLFILCTINIALIHILYETMNIYFSFLIILALFVIAIYGSVILNAFAIILFTLELVTYLYFLYPTFTEAIGKTNVAVLIIILSFLFAISLIQGFYFSFSYRKIENKSHAVENEFLSKEGYLKLFFENAKDSIAVFDLNNTVLAVNPAFEKLYGWDAGDCIGNSLPMVPPLQYNQSIDRIDRMLKGESFDLLETIDMKKDGTLFYAEVTLSPIFDAQGQVIATSVITRDISYRKEAEELLVQSEKLSIAGEMAAGVAHEIRNPLTVISGFTQMMEASGDSQYQDYFKIINDEIERINLIISEFLILSKPQLKETRNFNISTTLNNIFMLFQPKMDIKSIHFSICYLQDEILINGNENQLKQVFINILKNALEATAEGGEISIHSEISEHTIDITIEDTGLGMRKEVIDKIFNPFFTTKQEGTGLGMMISNKIIQEHNGQISISSEVNIGTAITISLPISTTSDEQPNKI